jgi:hypothetical protein
MGAVESNDWGVLPGWILPRPVLTTRYLTAGIFEFF